VQVALHLCTISQQSAYFENVCIRIQKPVLGLVKQKGIMSASVSPYAQIATPNWLLNLHFAAACAAFSAREQKG